MKYAVFHVDLRLQMLASSNSQVVQKFHTHPSTKAVQPVILFILVMSNAYLDG